MGNINRNCLSSRDLYPSIINLVNSPFETLNGSKKFSLRLYQFAGDVSVEFIKGEGRKTKFNFRARIKRKRTLKQEVALFDAPLFENHG